MATFKLTEKGLIKPMHLGFLKRYQMLCWVHICGTKLSVGARVRGRLKIFPSRNKAKENLTEDFKKGKEHGRSLRDIKLYELSKELGFPGD